MSNVESPGKPELKREADVYRLTWPCGVAADVERISEHSDGISAEVSVYSDRLPEVRLLHSSRLNLMSAQTRRTLVQSLEKRDSSVDWAQLVEEMCLIVREAHRAGEPPVDMRSYAPTVQPRWLLEPFVERAGPTVIFADGGSSKSFLALAIAASIATGKPIVGRPHEEPTPVLYVDFETDPDTMHERLTAVLSGAGITERPPFHYKRLAASIPEAASTVRREVAKLGVGFVVIDSLGAARGGEPESADFTIRLFNAARSLGVPWLGVDHVAKAQGNDATRPFGSTYSHNLARLTWSADKHQDSGSDELVVALMNRKRNNGRLLGTRGYRIRFENDMLERLVSVRFEAQDVTDVSELAKHVPLKERILAELRSGPRTQPEIADALGADATQVRARVADLVKAERLVRDGDRVALRSHMN